MLILLQKKLTKREVEAVVTSIYVKLHTLALNVGAMQQAFKKRNLYLPVLYELSVHPRYYYNLNKANVGGSMYFLQVACLSRSPKAD